MAGALLDAEWEWALAHSGFVEVEWGPRIDVFSGSRHESDAAEFGTKGVSIRAVKGG